MSWNWDKIKWEKIIYIENKKANEKDFKKAIKTIINQSKKIRKLRKINQTYLVHRLSTRTQEHSFSIVHRPECEQGS